MKYNPQIDGLRCIAVMLVFASHLIPHLNEYVPQVGYSGVELFFAISGFLITSILLKSEDAFADSYKRFIGRRTMRIFPIYYLTIFLLFMTEPDQLGGRLSSLLTYTYIYSPEYKPDHLSHIWSLCVEEQFYLFWPFVVLLRRRNIRLLKGITAVLIAICIVQLLFPFVQMTDNQSKIWPFPRGLGLLVGSFGAMTKLPSASNRLLVPLFAATIFIDHPISRVIMPVACLLIVLNTFRVQSRLLTNNSMVRLGIISYGFYLFHKPLAHFGAHTILPLMWTSIPQWGVLGKLQYNQWLQAWLNIPVTFVLTVLAAHLSFIVIEKPILSLKDKWFSNEKTKQKNISQVSLPA